MEDCKTKKMLVAHCSLSDVEFLPLPMFSWEQVPLKWLDSLLQVIMAYLELICVAFDSLARPVTLWADFGSVVLSSAIRL